MTHYSFPGLTYYAPMSSEVFRGNIRYRTNDLINIRTGEPIRHYYKGHPFVPPRSRRRQQVCAVGKNESTRTCARDRLRLTEYMNPPILFDAAARRRRKP